MRLVRRGHEPAWLPVAAVAVAVLVTVALSAIPIRLAGANPPAAFERYLLVPLSSTLGIYEVMLTATPLLFTGIAVAIAFRAGYWNIGAEGQFLMGAVATTALALNAPDLPARCGAAAGVRRRWSRRAGLGLAARLAEAAWGHRRGGHDPAAQPGRPARRTGAC